MPSSSNAAAEDPGLHREVRGFGAHGQYRSTVVGDAELAVAAAAGDRAALADIYDRYADSLHELCRAILHDAHEASDAVHDTFVIASTRLDQLREPDRLKAWLCAIARRESIRRSSKRARMRPSHDEVLDVPVMDDPARAPIADDAAALVWEAASALTDRERALLVLNVRQGLDGADLADAAGLPGPQASVVLSRAKTQLANAVRCTLLIRSGRSDCAELTALVPKAHHALDGLTRKRVARHAQGCEHCELKWNASPDALGILAAAPLLGAPAALKREVYDDVELISSSKRLGGGRWRADGFPAGDERDARRPIVVSIAAALILVVVAIALVFAGNDDGPTLSATDAPETTTTTAASVAGITPTTLPTDATATTVTRRSTTTRRGQTATTLRRPGGAATTAAPVASPPTPAPTAPPAFRIASTSGPRSVSTCESGTYTATVEGSGPQFLVLSYSGPGSGRTFMQRNGNTYSVNLQIGPAGTYSWTVSGGGATSPTKQVTVTECATTPG